jgi:protoheme IX farnesyltransferase
VSAPDVRIVDPRASGGWATVKAYIELTKPRIIELLLITTVPAMVVAAGGWPDTWLVLATLIGGTLSAGGANTINQVIDRDIDQVMNRTRGRPLPTDRVGVRAALVYGVVLGVAGFFWLWATTNLLAASLSTAGLLFYVFVYSLYLKRTSKQNIVIGGAAGAAPVLVGWAAVTGTLALPAWIMFAIVFFWTPPHFWALALRYTKDYRNAGIPMLPVVVGEKVTLQQILLYSIVVSGVSLLLVPVVPTGVIYSVVAVVLGALLIVGAERLRRNRTHPMTYFGFTNLYLAGVFLAMAVDTLVS